MGGTESIEAQHKIMAEQLQYFCETVQRIVDGTAGEDLSVPLNVLQQAEGLVLTKVIKAGVGLSIQGGVGLVLKKLPDGTWSGPMAISTGGVALGLQLGASSTETLLVLNTAEAVNAFRQSSSVSIGGNFSVAAGPLGRQWDASLQTMENWTFVECYSYSLSEGLFAGVAVQGMVLSSRDELNTAFYNLGTETRVSAAQILDGKIQIPLTTEYLRLMELLVAVSEGTDVVTVEEEEEEVDEKANENSSTKQPEKSINKIAEAAAAAAEKKRRRKMRMLQARQTKASARQRAQGIGVTMVRQQYINDANNALLPEMTTWMSGILNEPVDAKTFLADLRDGTRLCKLISLVNQSTIPEFKRAPTTEVDFTQNLATFARGCIALDMQESSTITFKDIDDGNLTKVLSCLVTLSRHAEAYNIPALPSISKAVTGVPAPGASLKAMSEEQRESLRKLYASDLPLPHW
jgi:lipid-binding SYLF domain-containing protein